MEDKILIKKHAKKYCTRCLTDIGEYVVLKTMYERTAGVMFSNGMYKCNCCGIVAIVDDSYEELRIEGNHIVKKLTTVIE